MLGIANYKIREIIDKTPSYTQRNEKVRLAVKLTCKALINSAILLNDIGSPNINYIRDRDVSIGSKRTLDFITILGRQVLSYVPGLSHLYDVSTMSSIIEKHIERVPDLRRLFDHQLDHIDVIHQSRNHTHQRAAALRTSVNSALCNLAQRAGFQPYVVSLSSSDHLVGVAGSRSFYNSKDLGVPHREDVVHENTCFVFTDVDYYVDINKFLKNFKPMLLYTFVPNEVSGNDAYRGHQYQIINNIVYYTVSGGGNYSHKLWDYKGDTISIIDDNFALLTFDITQKVINSDNCRRVISILPRTKTPWPYYNHIKYTNGINYKEITFGPINLLYNPILDEVSIGMNMSAHSELVSAKLLCAIKHRISSKTTKSPVAGDIEVFLLDEASKLRDEIEKAAKAGKPKPKLPRYLRNTKTTATLLSETLPWLYYLPPNVVHTTGLDSTYVAIGPVTIYEAKTPHAEFATPLVTCPALVPAKNENNEVAAIEGRVIKVANDVEPPVEYKKFANEFIDLCVPKPKIVSGLSYDEVLIMQDKVAQRARAELVLDTLGPDPENSLKSFIKGEGYDAMSDPRVITTMKPALTIGMTRFTAQFKELILKKHKWYGPGKTPSEALERIREIGGNGLIDTDYSRFDGTVSKFLQTRVVLPCYMRGLTTAASREFLAMFNKVFKPKGKTQNGVQYDAGWGTRSGSPLTTCGNTIINAFVTYCALRKIGHDSKVAWANLGIYAGDDGLSPNVLGLADSIANVSESLGLKVKMETHGVNEEVPFLGRIIIHPLTHKDSYQDIKRTLPKLHITFNKDVTLAQAGYNKAIGYLNTDYMTPLISDWAHKVASASGLNSVKNARADEMWKLNQSWPQENPDLIRASALKRLNITDGEYEVMRKDIASVVDSFPLQMPVLIMNDYGHKLDGRYGDQVITTTGNRITNPELKCKTQETKTQLSSKPATTPGENMVQTTSGKTSDSTKKNSENLSPKASLPRRLTLKQSVKPSTSSAMPASPKLTGEQNRESQPNSAKPTSITSAKSEASSAKSRKQRSKHEPRPKTRNKKTNKPSKSSKGSPKNS